MSKTRSASPVFIVTQPMGLDPVVVEEMKASVTGLAVEEVQSQEVRFRCECPADEITGLRSISDAWLVVREFDGIGARYRDLRTLTEQVGRTDLIASIDVLRAAGFRPKHSMSFAVNGTMRGVRAYRRQDSLEAVEEGIVHWSGGRLKPVIGPADLRLWLHLSEERARLCLALSAAPAGQRHREVSLPASLPGPHAYAMAALTKPKADQVFVDLTCGSGSIALERAENWRHNMILAGDIDRKAVQATAANFGRRHRPREIIQWDGGALPLPDECVDALACNPPHGVQMRPEAGLESLYRGLLSEAARVLSPYALMTFLTPRRAMTDDLLRRDGRMRILRCFVVDLLGQRPYLYVLRRTP
ncbi:MAG: methyltransferase [Anaerolineae bacterium]